MKSFALLLLTMCVGAGTTWADDAFAWGRVQDKSVYFELYGGLGQMSSLSGSVTETVNGVPISGGLNTDLNDLGIDGGTESVLFGGRIIGKWLTLLVDVRDNTIRASGTADTDIRLSVDGLSFGGASLDYLLIPVDSEFDIDSDSLWVGAGLRITPFTLNPSGRVRFTPWLHFGAQWIDTSFDIDSGNTVRVEVPGFGDRAYAVNGRASGSAQLVIPEVGLGAELRWRFHDEGEPGPELVFSGTYKLLNYDGTLDAIGFNDDEFDELVIDYAALDVGVDLVWPLGSSVALTAGLYLEQADGEVELDSKPSAGDFQRDLNAKYSLYGFRAGLRF